MNFTRRWVVVVILTIVFLITLLHTTTVTTSKPIKPNKIPDINPDNSPTKVENPSKAYNRHWWKNYIEKHPVQSIIPLPTGNPPSVPRIQFDFPATEDPQAKAIREERRDVVKNAFLRTWGAYKEHAWTADELGPVQGNVKATFGGWGATLVDTLDTLWMMGLKDEFEEAVEASRNIDFSDTSTDRLNVFETTIRYLGGFLAAYDISEHKYPVLLDKAIEVGDLLYVAFDTPNRLPVLRWLWEKSSNGDDQEADSSSIVAELGSLSLEFTRLTQLTSDAKYFDAIQRITDVLEKHQDDTKLPGLWPWMVDTRSSKFSRESRFTFGGMADSLYEYLPKEYLMLGGRLEQYKNMYAKSIDVAKDTLFFRPKTKGSKDILFSGYINISSRNSRKLQAEGQHLACFAGGMVATAAKIFNRPDEVEVGRKLTEGCIWAYRSMPSGIMPEVFRAVPCTEEDETCEWDPQVWFRDVKYKDYTEEEIEDEVRSRNLVPGILSVDDKRYLLR